MSIPQPYDTGLTEEQLAEAFRRALGDMTDEEIEKAIATAISLIPKGLVYRGAYNYFSELPTNAKEGEVYTVKYKGTSGTEPDGNEYAWGEYEGTLQWIPLGVNAYNKDEIDAMHDEMQTEIDANKSDILSAKNDIAINRVTLGAQNKNSLPNTREVNKTYESNGVTFTLNADRSVTCSGQSISGDNAYFQFSTERVEIAANTPMILSGCPSGGSETTYLIQLYRYTGGNPEEVVEMVDTGEPTTKYMRKGKYRGYIKINGGVDATGLTFHPMLRHADITDNAYEPYKPSLQSQINALIAEIAELKTQITTG